MKTYYAKPNGTVHGLNKGNVYHFKSEEWEGLSKEFDQLNWKYRNVFMTDDERIEFGIKRETVRSKLGNLVLEIYNDRKKEWIKAGIQGFTIVPCLFNE